MVKWVNFKLQPFKPDPFIREITGTVGWEGVPLVTYRFQGDLEQIDFPSHQGRQDKLWEGTSFELFLKKKTSSEYYEHNYAPISAWNCFHFQNYREGKSNFDIQDPKVILEKSRTVGVLSGGFYLPWKESIEVGISAVIKNKSGGLSYWNLSPMGETPNFHDPKSFTLEVLPIC